jgi:hypothetical protein
MQEAKPALTSIELKTIIESYSYTFSNEIQLQDGIKKVFDINSVQYEREKNYGNNRIDFVHSTIAIEIKTKQSSTHIMQQLDRYARIDTITELILITTRRTHQVPTALNNKPITTILINSSL